MLKEVREQRGKTIAELSRESKVSKVLIRKIESGYANAKNSTLWKLANALNVGIEEIRN